MLALPCTIPKENCQNPSYLPTNLFLPSISYLSHSVALIFILHHPDHAKDGLFRLTCVLFGCDRYGRISAEENSLFLDLIRSASLVSIVSMFVVGEHHEGDKCISCENFESKFWTGTKPKRVIFFLVSSLLPALLVCLSLATNNVNPPSLFAQRFLHSRPSLHGFPNFISILSSFSTPAKICKF